MVIWEVSWGPRLSEILPAKDVSVFWGFLLTSEDVSASKVWSQLSLRSQPHFWGFLWLLRMSDFWRFFRFARIFTGFSRCFSFQSLKSAQPQKSAPLVRILLTSENFWLLKIFPICEDFYWPLRMFQPPKSEVSSASEVSLTSEDFSDIWGCLQLSEDLYLLNISGAVRPQCSTQQ